MKSNVLSLLLVYIFFKGLTLSKKHRNRNDIHTPNIMLTLSISVPEVLKLKTNILVPCQLLNLPGKCFIVCTTYFYFFST